MYFKDPKENASKLLLKTVNDKTIDVYHVSNDFRFATAVAEFGMLLKHSAYRQNSNYADVIDLANSSKSNDDNGYRAEFIRLVQMARDLKDDETTSVVPPAAPHRIIPLNPYLKNKKHKTSLVNIVPLVVN